jgi:hemophore-related protein
MTLCPGSVRHALAAVLGAGAVAASVFTWAPAAIADAPNCTAADMAAVAAGVSAATSAYLFTHPDVNEFVTNLKGQPLDQVLNDVQVYLDARPQTKAEIRAIRQPLADLRTRCGIGGDDAANDVGVNAMPMVR